MVTNSRKAIRTEQIPNGSRMRASELFKTDIEYITSTEFEAMFAARASLKKFESVSTRVRRAQTSDNDNSLVCLAPALSDPLLSFAEEQYEFRRMNYLKFVASRLRSSLNQQRPSIRKMDEIDQTLQDANDARDRIIRANLRLVISNARKYCSTTYLFEDLVSDGSLALMEAVDKFDYQRGFRFSTYATHAIRRSFFRKIERRQKDRQRFVATDPIAINATPDDFEIDFDAPAETILIDRVVGGLDQYLSERERQIIEGRFGLNGRAEPSTLLQLASELGICKERVRQVEGIAIKKLHAVAISYATVRSE